MILLIRLPPPPTSSSPSYGVFALSSVAYRSREAESLTDMQARLLCKGSMPSTIRIAKTVLVASEETDGIEVTTGPLGNSAFKQGSRVHPQDKLKEA